MIDEVNRAFGGPPVEMVLSLSKNLSPTNSRSKAGYKKIAENEDEVMAHWSFTGIHIGPWLGVRQLVRRSQQMNLAFLV